MPKKIFVLDTNVILHDYNCIQNFEKHDVVLPITVLEELDQFKKGHEQINFNARYFIRSLDTLSGDKLVSQGVQIDEGKGKIRIVTSELQRPEVKRVFTSDQPDHRILSVALDITLAHPKQQVVLVSKDINLRLKAKSLGLRAQDYATDKIEDIRTLYTGRRIVENFPHEPIDMLYRTRDPLDPTAFELENVRPNEYFILKNMQKSVLAVYNPQLQGIERVEKRNAYGIIPRNAEQTFALNALMNPNVLLVSLAGKAGTGKTLLALAAALETRKQFHQIYLARPIVPLSNKDMGYLPGDIEAKLDPYMQPIYDNLNVIKNQFLERDKDYKRIDDMLKTEKLYISPLSYIRGRSLEKIFFIVDEAQNLTPHEVKTIITRAGEGTKIIFTGDPYQIDTPYLDAQSNGLTYLIDRMKGQSVYAHITLERGERSLLADLASDLL